MIDAAALSASETFDADFCVVGSGAGGAVAAWALAGAGHRVVILEEGGSYSAPDYTRNGMEMVSKLYRESGTFATTSLPFVQIPHGRCVGGTTVVNCGSSFRIPEGHWKKWTTFFPREPFEAAYREIEERLSIAPAPASSVAKQNLLLKQGAGKLGYAGGFIPRNAPDCRGAGNCNLGCPTGAKLSMERSFVPWAIERGAKLVYHLRADRIRVRSGGADIDATDATGRRHTVRTRKVLVAAGALHTPGLLRRSHLFAGGFRARRAGLSRHTGRNLTIHPSSGISGEFPDPVELWKGAPQGYYVDHFAEDGIVFEGIGMPPDLAALNLLTHGEQHAAFMRRLRHMASIGLMVSDEPVGTVRHWPLGLVQVGYRITDAVLAAMKKAFVEGARILLAAGAERVHVAIQGHEAVTDPDRLDLSRVTARKIRWNAFHPLGTCRVGATADDGTVDPTGRVHGTDAVYVCDGSVLPGSTRFNPQLTIMAAALHVARGLA